VTGLSKNVIERCDAAIEVPMQGKKESLNIAVCFGIIAYRFG
jgi:tRNA G18 (ribose-2'-O)-methylase SpoU